MASLAADQLIFNSKWNLESFLGNMNSHLKIIPDFRNDIDVLDFAHLGGVTWSERFA